MNSYIPNTKNNYIIFTKNIIDSSNVGSLLYIKEKIMDLSINNRSDISWQRILTTQNNNFTDYKNRIILSGKINSITTTGTIASSTSCCLITQNNIKNNMKFIFDLSNNPNGKILFVKNLNTSDNLHNYLFNNLNNTLFENDTPYNIHNSLTTTSVDAIYNRYIYHLNYYLSKYDIYKINIRDYVYKYTYEISNNNLLTEDKKDLIYNDISYSIKDICNNFYFINTTIDSASLINFNSNNFSRLLIDNSNINSFISLNTDLYILEKDIDYSIYRNIWSYNKLTLDYRHDNYYDFSLNFTFNSNTRSSIIRTFLIKTNNFQILQNIKKHSKIIFGSKNIYLNNIKVLDKNSTLYSQSITYNNSTTTLNKDFSNLILLGIGNQVTGITQHDIYRHSHLSSNTSIITFKKDINTGIINSKFPSLIPNLDKKYLLDIPLNYTNNIDVNNSYNINNTIKFNSILYNTASQVNSSRFFDINLYKYFDAISNNYFTNSFNNLAFLNKLTNNIYSISSEQVNLAIYVRLKNFIKESNIKLLNRETLEKDLLSLKSDDAYDLRYNYNQNFYLSNNLDILLALKSLKLTNKFSIESYQSDYNLLNFYTLTIGNLIKTSGASDFTNVDCIYIYHDPINDPDERFRYPNNNIEIRRDAEIDTLSKAIEQYRGGGSRTSTTNAAFVPSQNGSNLSRKMIQGIIGLNNIPKLLSIEPYDPNFINGRGFINQFQIEDTCITSDCDKIAVKQNAIKHDSVKNNRIYSSNSLKKQNFANIVKSNVRNKVSQDCITKIKSTTPPIINVPCTDGANVKKYTPFVLFTKGKGNYLR